MVAVAGPAADAAVSPEQAPYLAYISPYLAYISLYLPCISPISPLYLPRISLISRGWPRGRQPQAGARAATRCAQAATPCAQAATLEYVPRLQPYVSAQIRRPRFYLPIPYLPVPSYISLYLPMSPHISPHLTTSPHISPAPRRVVVRTRPGSVAAYP